MGWREVKGPTGTYYYDSKTRETSWSIPEGWEKKGKKLVRQKSKGNLVPSTPAPPPPAGDSGDDEPRGEPAELSEKERSLSAMLSPKEKEMMAQTLRNPAPIKKKKKKSGPALALPSQQAREVKSTPSSLSGKSESKGSDDEGGWKATKSPTGATYYYHTKTKATRWDMPPEMAAAAQSSGPAVSSDVGQLQVDLREAKEAQATAEKAAELAEKKTADIAALREKDRSQVATLRAELESATAKSEMLHAQMQEEAARMRQELDAARGDAGTARQAEQDARTQLEQHLSAQSSVSASSEQQLAQKEAELQILRQQVSELQTSSNASDAVKAQLDGLLQQQAQLQQSASESAAALSQRQQEVEFLQGQIGGQHEQAQQLHSQLQQYQAAAGQAEAEMRRLNTQLQAEHLVKRKLNERLAAASGNVEELPALRSQVGALTQQLEEAQTREKQRQEQWAGLERTMRQQLETTMQAAKQAAGERNQAQMEARKNAEAVAQLQQQLEAAAQQQRQQQPASNPVPAAVYPTQPKQGIPPARPVQGFGAQQVHAVQPVQPKQAVPPPVTLQGSPGGGDRPPVVEPGGGTYAPVGAVARHNPAGNLVRQNSGNVAAPPPPAQMRPEEKFALHAFFHGQLSGGQAEQMLSGRPVGSFLFRFSSQPGHLAVSYMWAQNQVQSALIGFTPDGIVWNTDTPEIKHPDLSSFIKGTGHILIHPVTKAG